ncbi:MAG: S8 family serine peptidase [Cyanobacteria bacterium]|nr:S8 family serine peptidase [Cyanobacteriota bacterium]
MVTFKKESDLNNDNKAKVISANSKANQSKKHKQLLESLVGANDLVAINQLSTDDNHAQSFLKGRNKAKLSKKQLKRLAVLKKIDESADSRTFTLKTKNNCKKLKKLMKKIRKNKEVLTISPVAQYKLQSSDPFFESTGADWAFNYDELWGFKQIDAEAAWDNTRGAGITVAVIDSGLDINHPDINDNVGLRQNLTNNSNDVTDFSGHGTHVAGTIAAEADNDEGIAGVAPEATIMTLKVQTDAQAGSPALSGAAILNAITFAIENDADIINASLGGTISIPGNPLTYDQLIGFKNIYDGYIDDGDSEVTARNRFKANIAGGNDIITDAAIAEFRSIDRWQAAVEAGITVVVAAGNNDKDANTEIPAAIPEMITVGASTEHENRASFSNFGTSVDIAAPGGADNPVRANDNFAFNDNLAAGAGYLRGLRDNSLIIDNILSLNSSTQTRYRHLVFNLTSGETNSVFNNTRNFVPSASDEELDLSIDQFFDRPNTSNQYKSIGGTSMAAPHVAGAAALMLAANPELSPAEVRNILVEEADPIGTDRAIGPRLNVARAVQRVVDELEQAANPVTQPSLQIPTNNTNFIMTKSPEFVWSGGNIDPANGGSYKLFIDGLVKYQGTATRFQSTEVLNNRNHIWSVGACNSLNNCKFSDLGSFIISSFDRMPEIISPDSSSPIITGDIDFEWSNLGTGITYNYQVLERDENTGPQAPLATGNTENTSLVINLSPANYQFKVQACINDECGDFRTRDFTVEPEPEPEPEPPIETTMDKRALTDSLRTKMAHLRKFKSRDAYRNYITDNGIRKIKATFTGGYNASLNRFKILHLLVNENKPEHVEAITDYMQIIIQRLLPVSEFITDNHRESRRFAFKPENGLVPGKPGPTEFITFIEMLNKLKRIANSFILDEDLKTEYIAFLESFKSKALPPNPFAMVDYIDNDRNSLKTEINQISASNDSTASSTTEPVLSSQSIEELKALVTEHLSLSKRLGINPAVAIVLSKANIQDYIFDENLFKTKLATATIEYNNANRYYQELKNRSGYDDSALDISFDFVKDWAINKPYQSSSDIEAEVTSASSTACFTNPSGQNVSQTVLINGTDRINLDFEMACQESGTIPLLDLDGDGNDEIVISNLAAGSNNLRANVISLDGTVINSWDISSVNDQVDPEQFGINAVDINEDDQLDIVSYFYNEKADGIYLESRGFNPDGTPIEGSNDSILVETINHIDPPRPGPPDPVPEIPGFLPPPILEPSLDPSNPDPSNPGPIVVPIPRAKPGQPQAPKVKPGPRKISPVINNPTKEDKETIKDLLDDRKNNSGPSAAEAGTNQQIIKDILDVVDEDNNGVLEKANLLDSYLKTQVAKNSQDLRYDFNQDGVVDKLDSTIMRSIYAQYVDGIRGDFKLVK